MENSGNLILYDNKGLSRWYQGNFIDADQISPIINEVYVLSLRKKTYCHIKGSCYIGCYFVDQNTASLAKSNSTYGKTIESCISMCYMDFFNYAAVYNGQEKDYPRNLSDAYNI